MGKKLTYEFVKNYFKEDWESKLKIAINNKIPLQKIGSVYI